MARQPTNKYLMQDYRDVMGTSDAPQNIDTDMPVTPVSILNNGLPRASSKQTLKTYYFTLTGAATSRLFVPLVAGTTNYFVGITFGTTSTATATAILAYDAASGAVPAAPNDAVFANYDNPAGQSNYMIFPPMAKKINQGIGVEQQGIGAGQSVFVVVYYLEEKGD